MSAADDDPFLAPTPGRRRDFGRRKPAAARAAFGDAENSPEAPLSPGPEAAEPEEPPPRRKRKTQGGGARAGADGEFSVSDINREFALVLLGSRAIVMQMAEEGPIDERQRVLTIEAFQTWFGNRFVMVDGRLKTWANAWLQNRERRQYEGVEFHPDPRNAAGAPRRLNLWRGFAFAAAPKANGYKTFRDHLLNNVCRGDDRLYAWVFGIFAHIVQRPRERVGTALVLRGGMGCGKTVVGEHFGALFPSHYFLVDDPRYVTGQFNAHMASCLLLQADEAVWAGDKAAEGRLKGLVTSPMQQIEAKGVDPIRLENYVRLVMTSNEAWVVPAGRDERRFCVLDVDARCAQNSEYFGEMRAELTDGGYAALLADLLAFDLASVDLRRIPKTDALLDQKERSLDSVPMWWLGRLMAGAPTLKHAGWAERVARDALYSDYLEDCDRVGVRRKREQTIFGREFAALTPGLSTVRGLQSDGSRRREYVLPPLEECRAAWDDWTSQKRVWPAGEGDDDGETGEFDG